MEQSIYERHHKQEVNMGLPDYLDNRPDLGAHTGVLRKAQAEAWNNRHIAGDPHEEATFAPLDLDRPVTATEVRAFNAEADPTGRSPHEKGAKVDAGKCRPALVLGGFARSLWAVSEIGTFGAVKYTEDGWIEVPNGEARYDDAKMRHWLKDKMGQTVDEDSEKLHLAHEAWNALARLDLYLRNKERNAV